MENPTVPTVKVAIQNLAEALQIENSTKEGIALLAQQVAENVKDPLKATLALSPINEFVKELKSALSNDTLQVIKGVPKEERRMGKLTYDAVIRKNYDYKQDATCVNLQTQLKERQSVIQRDNIIEPTETEYIKITIPKV